MVWAADKTDDASSENKKRTALEEANLINETVLRERGCDNIQNSKPMGTVKSVMAEKLERPTNK